MSANIWEKILRRLRRGMQEEDFRRWFGATAYASDSGDQITVWVPSESIRRHLSVHYEDSISRILAALDRPNTDIRFVVAGLGDEDEDDEDKDK